MLTLHLEKKITKFMELWEAVQPFLEGWLNAMQDASADALPPAQGEPAAPSTGPSPMEISAILENKRKLEMWEQCQNVKADLIKLERVQGTFLRAELDLPTVTSTLSLTDAVDEALKEHISGEKALRGMNQNACLGDMKCYRDWLSRAYRGTRWEEENVGTPHPIPTFQRKNNDLDLAHSIYRVYEKHYRLSRS